MAIISFALQAERLRQSSWLDAIGNAWLILWAGMVVKLILPHALANGMRPLLLAAPLLPLVAKDLSHLPDALARSRAAVAARARRSFPPRPCAAPRLPGLAAPPSPASNAGRPAVPSPISNEAPIAPPWRSSCSRPSSNCRSVPRSCRSSCTKPLPSA
jgi:hypothetical protein